MARTLALAVALLAACAASSPAFRPPPLAGRRAEVLAPDLTGREVDVLAAAAPVRVVDFWASWCEPCREQLPALERLARTYGPRGLAVYAVAFDEDRNQVQAFLEQTPVSFPVLWDKGGARLSGRFEVTRLPTTLVVDGAGTIRAVHLGFDAAEGARIEDEVRRLLPP
jgi:thiol-disulfide isomerase/thioredoxin